MEDIKSYYQYILIMFFSVLLNGCSNLHWGNVINETNDVITIKLTFSNEHGTRFLETSVKPNSSEIWEYDQSLLLSTQIDKNLVQFEATNSEGCTITFNREAIVKLAEKHRQQIIVKPQYFVDICKTQMKIDGGYSLFFVVNLDTAFKMIYI